MSYRLLIIDDAPELIEDLTALLKNKYAVISAQNPQSGLKMVDVESPDIVLLDLMFENSQMNGLDILKKIRRIDEFLPVIIITDYASVDTAVQAIRLGATDYISKTPSLKKLDIIISRAINNRTTQIHSKSMLEETGRPYHNMVGKSAAISRLLHEIRLMSGNDNPVLISGESGTGKELVARHIHNMSSRHDQPFVALNCAAIPRELIESILFGHEKGAFTGADSRKPGKFELATKGSLFFDEISELSLEAQAKLLRVLQEKEFERVGGNATIKSDARIIAATNINLSNAVREGRFRNDLFYRLEVLKIQVPPLRNRTEDIPLLAQHFMQLACEDQKIKSKFISPPAMDQLLQYDWPGNIRELSNLITRSAILTQGTTVGKFSELEPGNSLGSALQTPVNREELDSLRKKAAQTAKQEIEKRFLNHFLKLAQGNITRAAKLAKINRTSFHKMIKRVGLLK